ncbi:TPA: hypothetical protein ACSCYS_004246 [Aeromonas veronii]
MNNKFIKFGVCLVAAGVIFLSVLLGNYVGEAGVNYMQSQMEKNSEREGLVLKNKSASSQLSNAVIIKSVPTKKPVSNACIAAAKLLVNSSYPSSSFEIIYKTPAYVTEIYSDEHDLCVVSAEIKEKSAQESYRNSMSINMIGEFNNTSKITELVYLDYNATKAASGAFEKIYHTAHQDDGPVNVRVYMYDEVLVDQPQIPHSKLTSGAQEGQVIIDIKPISATNNSLTFMGFIGQQKCFVTVNANSDYNISSPFEGRDWALSENAINCKTN